MGKESIEMAKSGQIKGYRQREVRTVYTGLSMKC